MADDYSSFTDPTDTQKYREQYILGAWLKGEHREDIKYLRAQFFENYYYLFKDITTKTAEAVPDFVPPLKSKHEITEAQVLSWTVEYSGTPNKDIYYKEYVKQLVIDSMAAEIMNPEGKGTKHIVAGAETLQQLEKSWETKTENCSTWLSDYLGELDLRKEQRPLKYDINELNKLNIKLGGLKQGELTTIAARPGIGKSTLALQTAEALAKEGHKILYFNLEMTMNQIADRLIIKHTNVPISHLREGDLTKDEWGEVSIALDKLQDVQKNIVFKTRNRNVDFFKDFIEEEKPELIIVDQLSHLTSTRTAPSIRESYIHMVETLKEEIAVPYNIPVLLLAQLNRNADKPGTKPSMADLKESGVIEETSDNVLLLYAEDDKDVEEGKDILPCVIRIAKNRQGELGSVHVTFKKNKCYFSRQVADPSGPRSRSQKTY